jgi:transcriptional regulator with XRE-family HTH domain
MGVVTMAAGGSLVVRRQLGAKLKHLRAAAGKSLADVDASGIASKAKLSRIESGKSPVKIVDVWGLCRLYGASPETTDALAALAPGTQQDNWWEAYGSAVVADWFGLYAGLEAAASKIRAFEPQLVHGLVQTEDYARAAISADPRLSADVVEQRVRFRLDRQRARAEQTIITTEGVLRMVTGSPEIMAAQVEHLRSVDATVLVVPFTAGAYPLRRGFVLLDFDDADDPSIAYIDGPPAARYLDQPDDRAEYEFVWQVIEDMSIPIEEWQP